MIHELLVIHHSHTDVGYTHPQPVFWELSRRFIDEALDLCDETADWPEASRLRWTCEVIAPVIDWLHHASDRQIQRFADIAERGQIAIGAMFCNFTPLCNLEELAQSLLPVRMLRARFALPVSVAINHDVNGLPWPIVGLLRDAGIDGLLMGINVHFGGFPLHRPLAFQWAGPDGRSILAFNGEHYGTFDAELGLADPDVTTDRMSEGLTKYIRKLERADYPYDFVYITATHPSFCDNNPPNPQLLRLIRQWNDEQRNPLIRFATPEMVIERIRRQPSETIPTHRGDWTDYWNFGSGSAALETAVNRRSRARLHASQMLGTVQPYTGDESGRMREARWNVHLHDEHTWGSFCGILSKCPTLYADQWTFKAETAYRGASLAGMLMRDQMDALAGNPKHGSGVAGFLVFNPAPVDRRVCFAVHKPLLDGRWRHLSSSVHRLDIEYTLRREECEVYGIDGVMVGPVEVPALSCRVVARKDLREAEIPAGIRISDRTIDSSHHHLRFDPGTGRILELHDKALDRDIIEAAGEWEFFGFVRETAAELNERARKLNDPREVFFKSDWEAIHEGKSCWIPDWKARRVGPRETVAVEVEPTPEGPRLVRRYRAEGVEDLKQIITLCEHEPGVRLEVMFKKEDVREPESIYFAFPLAITGWRAHFDTAGLATEFDAEQLPGSCRDWVTVDNYIAMHGDDLCVMLACPDAPLVQLGDFNFGKHQKSVPQRDRGLILAWAMNNYWHTNFRPSQPGYCRLRYELRCAPAFDPYQAALFGRTAASNVELHPIAERSLMLGERPVSSREGFFLTVAAVEGEGVTLDHLKPAEDETALIARLINHRDVPGVATLRLPERRIAGASIAGTLEDPRTPVPTQGDSVAIEILPRAAVTLHLQVEGQRGRQSLLPRTPRP